MQCVPCPLPSWTACPETNERLVIARPSKSGCSRSMPVSSTATLMPAPVYVEATTLVACRPQVACDSSWIA